MGRRRHAGKSNVPANVRFQRLWNCADAPAFPFGRSLGIVGHSTFRMKREAKLKTALDENRLLILGAQVVFGFQFDGIFQDQFDVLPGWSRTLACAGLILLILSIGLLVAPSMQHRLVERGQDSVRVLAWATEFAAWALLPLSIALALDLFIALERVGSATWGVVAGASFFAAAMACWYGLEFALKRKRKPMTGKQPPKPTPLDVQVDQLLTEARLIIPGAQALLGFQLTITLTQAFAQLPADAKIAHAVALCCVALAVILLMAPASLHRIAFGGEDDPQFVTIGSGFVIAAPLPLAFAIALDTYVAAGRAMSSATAAAVLAVAAIVALLGLWYAYPIWRRLARGPMRS